MHNPKLMDASKENAILAEQALVRLMPRLPEADADAKTIGDFIIAAKKRLPSQTAIDKDRKRKRTPVKAGK